jgi:hypothetical protein
MQNDLFLNSLTITFCYHHQLPFNRPPKDIRSSSLRVTNQILLCKLVGSPSSTQIQKVRLQCHLRCLAQEGIRSSQKLIIFYSKLMLKMSEGEFDLDLFSQTRWSFGSKMPGVLPGTGEYSFLQIIDYLLLKTIYRPIWDDHRCDCT